jgi:arylsulfatase A-like enzyme
MVGPAEAVTEEAIRRLEARADSPLFLWLLYMDPHWTYNPPAPHNQVIEWQGFDYYRELRSFKPAKASVFFNLNGRSEEARPLLERLYDAEIRYTDAAIGRLLEAVVGQGFGRNTMTVLTSDHGESLGEHGYYFQHGALVYQPTMRIPLVLHFPERIPRGLRIMDPVSIIDVAPTILTMLGLDPSAGGSFSGQDLSPLWRQGDDPASTHGRSTPVTGESGTVVYASNPIRHIGGRRSSNLRFLRDGSWVVVSKDGQLHLYDTATDPSLATDVADRHPQRTEAMAKVLENLPDHAGRWRMVRRGPWKLIRIPESGGVRWELYDLSEDPLETRDLSATRPEIVDAMRPLLDTTAASQGTDGFRAPRTIPEDVERQLEALGYLDG